ncbi:hypothetical protein F5Y18DRAFT_181197 [Xylariaceae sp. FL1019]|nr:hypothetical protein F5Y18DRAFT_181197 [Xylariaceae sp. FL1019]
MASPSDKPNEPDNSEPKNLVKEFGRPRERDLLMERQYHWPAWEVGMDMTDLWGSLHDQYNTLRIPIQCQEVFHLDVKELATRAKDHDEFHRLMAERSAARFQEVDDAHSRLGNILAMSPGEFPHNLWSKYIVFMRSWSAADLAIFFAGIESPGHKQEREEHDAWSARERAKYATTNVTAALTLPGSESHIVAPTLAPPSNELPAGAPIQPTDPTPPTSPSKTLKSRNHTSSECKQALPRSSRRQTRLQKETTDETAKRTLRARAAGLPRRKERGGKAPRKTGT